MIATVYAHQKSELLISENGFKKHQKGYQNYGTL